MKTFRTLGMMAVLAGAIVLLPACNDNKDDEPTPGPTGGVTDGDTNPFEGEIVLGDATLSDGVTQDGNTIAFPYVGGEAEVALSFTNADAKVAYALAGGEVPAWLEIAVTDSKLITVVKPTADEEVAEVTVTLKAIPALEADTTLRAFSALEADSTDTTISSLEVKVTRAAFSAHNGLKMVLVEGGTFMYGQGKSTSGADYSAAYAHEVTLSNYYMATTETTQALYEEIMGTNPAKTFIGDNYPVMYVTWSQACEFCNKLSLLDGLTPAYEKGDIIKISDAWGWSSFDFQDYIYIPEANGYRLPTNAEFEFAAKGGNEGCLNLTIYSGSDNYSEVGWWQDNSKVGSSYALHEVAQLKPNLLGIYDLSGNLGEWCYDWGVPYGYDRVTEPETNPTGIPYSAGVDSKSYRGGYYTTYNSKGCCYTEDKYTPEEAQATIGFRVVRNVK